MLKIDTQYANSVPGDADYPGGSIKNATAPGSLDGTPVDAVWKNDDLGWKYAMIAAAGITLSEDADTALISDLFNALKFVAGKNLYSDKIDYASGSHCQGSDEIEYIASTPNGPGTSLVNPVGDVTGTWTPATQSKVGSFTRDTSLAAGTQVITGVGFKPRFIIFLASTSLTIENSIGFDDGTGSGGMGGTGSSGLWAPRLESIHLVVSGGANFSTATITAKSADGFTLTWAKTGLPTGTATIKYMAIA